MLFARGLMAAGLLLAASVVGAQTQTIFTDNFESTTWKPEWVRSGTGPFRTVLSTTYKYAGTRGVAMDSSTSGTYATNRMDLKLGLSGHNAVTLTFRCRNVGDEIQTQDGLYYSNDDGATWSKLTWTVPAIGTTWSLQTINLSSQATTLGKPLNGRVRVRWQQYDNSPLSSDGMAFDDVTVTGTPIVSSVAGMGAMPYATGTAFRVWAPNATAVTVAGTFNGFNATSTPLVSEGNGNWSRSVDGALIGHEYKYVITHAGVANWRVDARAADVTNSVGNSVIADLGHTWVNNSFSMPGWNELVIYEMHIGTYNDAAGGNPGTWQSAIAKLDHVQNLGVNAVKVMPVAEFAGDWSWGYNPGHPFAPESVYGTPKDMKAFVDAAHGRGIAVILDVVYNHWGPSDLALWNYDGPSLGNGGIYFFADWRKSTPWGDTRPDYGRGEVRTYIRDNALYWLNEYRVDGLRWDSTVNIRTQNNGGGGDIADGWTLMQWVNNEIDAAAPWKISIAEDLQGNEFITKTTGAGGAGFDSQWDSGFVHPIRTAVITGNDADRNMFAVKDAVQRYYNGSHTQRVIYTESHDEVNNGRSRVPEEIWPGNAASWFSKKRSTLGAALVFTSPGVPMIFQGQEMLEDGFWSDTDPIDFAKATTHSGIVSMYRDMIRLRRNWYNNTRGLRGNNCNVFHVNNTNKVIAFHRWESGGAGDDVVVVANFGNTGYSSYNIGFPQGGTWNVRFNSDWNGYSGDFSNWNAYNTTANAGAKDGLGYNGNIGIGPYTVIILSQ